MRKARTGTRATQHVPRNMCHAIQNLQQLWREAPLGIGGLIGPATHVAQLFDGYQLRGAVGRAHACGALPTRADIAATLRDIRVVG